MNTVLLRVETELDPSAAPRVFGYLGGLGHVPVQAVLRRTQAEGLVIEVEFTAGIEAAELISAKFEQMPFVLNSRLGAEIVPGAIGHPPQAQALNTDKPTMTETAEVCHQAKPRFPRLSTAAMLRSTAALRGRAISHRAQLHLNG